MTTTVDVVADQALKAKHRALWALGNYGAVASEVIPDLGPVLVGAADIGVGQRVLDVAAGTGNAAIPAARRGAAVTASDLTPELLEAGEASVGDQLEDSVGTITWEVGDAEALPYADGSFDATISCVGVMFAPHHQVAADELARVTRSGGTIAHLSWTPEGFIGQMFATMKPFAPAPPPGALPPPLWGDEDHVRGLFGDSITGVVAARKSLLVDTFTGAEEFRDFFKRCYGPTIATYRSIADDPEKVAALDEALLELARRHGADSGTMSWEYLLFTAEKA